MDEPLPSEFSPVVRRLIFTGGALLLVIGIALLGFVFWADYQQLPAQEAAKPLVSLMAGFMFVLVGVMVMVTFWSERTGV